MQRASLRGVGREGVRALSVVAPLAEALGDKGARITKFGCDGDFSLVGLVVACGCC